MINKNKQKRQQGFTLVEVIVVAIIVAALAGVAIPMYTSYVKSSHTNAAANAAGSVASFMGSCINQVGTVSGIATGWVDGGPAVALKCYSAAAADTLSRMQLPKGIKFNVSSFTTTGVVKTVHNGGGDTTSYSY